METAEAISLLMNSPAVKAAMKTVTALTLLCSLWPEQAHVKDGDSFDFIVVGCGTAGSVLANRLTELDGCKVLCIEAGGDPPITTKIASLFPLSVNSPLDWQYRSQTDNNFGQELVQNNIELTLGKVLGGSSTIDHMVYSLGSPTDFDTWAEMTNDESWGSDSMLKYYKKSENLRDQEILNSPFKSFHGTDGYVKVARQPENVTLPYLNAFKEIGNDVVLDVAGTDGNGYVQSSLLSIYDNYRQDNAFAYLTPVKNRKNLYVLKNTKVQKIIIEGNVAVGVNVVGENNKCITLRANREVIVTAGAFNTAQLLMLSGIGPRPHLESRGINVIADLPVGKNYKDHSLVTIIHKLEKSVTPDLPPNPFKFPVPIFFGFVPIDKSQSYPDYLTINSFINNNAQYKILLLCSVTFQYKYEICQKIMKANVNRNILYSVHFLLHPESCGQVLLNTTNPNDPPLIYPGYYSNANDLDNHIKYVQDYTRVANSTYFKTVGGELLDLQLPECADFELGSYEYWRCYIPRMTTTAYHYSSTCSIGEVVDNKLKVKGLERLRIADASVMPTTISAPIKAAVNSIAERAADIIKADNSNYCNCQNDGHKHVEVQSYTNKLKKSIL